MAFILAVSAAGILGVADFFGGMATKRASVIPIMILSRAIGVVVLALALVIFPAGLRSADLAWGVAAGLAGGIGIALLYRGLAIGVMGVVAPVTAVISASLPVIAGLAFGDRPSLLALTGVGIALLAILLISQQPTRKGVLEDRRAASRALRQRGLGIALASGVAIGAFYILLSRTTSHSGLWPLAAARLAALGLFLMIGAATRVRLLPRGDVLLVASAAAVLDVLGTILFLFSVYRGPLALVAVLTSLYPASTVLLAALVLGERLSASRTAGLVCATVAVALIVAG